MHLDLRVPMGLLLLVIGTMLAAFGLVMHGNSMYTGYKGVEINLDWGLMMLGVGAVMFQMGRSPGRQLVMQPTRRTPRSTGRSGH